MTPTKNDPYAITGIQDDLDSDKTKMLRKVGVRMEIDKWFTSDDPDIEKQRMLFFPAFLKFMKMDPAKKLSWFQIAGIHGKPYVPWDEDGRVGKTSKEGYCTHASVLFTTWHRAYMLLWEQVIYELMKEQAEEFKDEEEKKDLLRVAKDWRFPYWDWAMKKPLRKSTGADDELRIEQHALKVLQNPDLKIHPDEDYNVPIVLDPEHSTIRLRTPRGEEDIPNAFVRFNMPKGWTMGQEELENLRITDSKVDLSDIKRKGNKDDKDEDDKNKEEEATLQYAKYTHTIRHARVLENIEAKSEKEWADTRAIVDALRSYTFSGDEHSRKGNLSASLRDAFYRLLTINNFEGFASKRFPDGIDRGKLGDFAFDSAEHLHDVMHLFCGGPPTQPDAQGNSQMGHMSHVPMAAFDPIFWLHHCNVDRLFAIWQVLHGDKGGWFDGTDPRDIDPGNFGIPSKNRDEPQDVLRPFHKGVDGSYFNSADVREVTALGYTYEHLEKWKHVVENTGEYDVDKHRDSLIKFLNCTYNSSRRAAQLRDETANTPNSNLQAMQGSLSLETPVEGPRNDYVVNIVYERMALQGKMFTIHVFIGDVPLNALEYDGAKNLVGKIPNFSAAVETNPDIPSCGNCRKQLEDQTRTTGRIVLTNALITRVSNEGIDDLTPLKDMEPKNVVPFLRRHLNWRVTCMGNVVSHSRIPSLKVSVAVGTAEHPKGKMSTFRNYMAAYEITEGRGGGAEPEDGLYPVDRVYKDDN